MFWTVALLLTATVALYTLLPLFRAIPARLEPGETADAALARAQLAELEEAVRERRMATREAAAARAEIGRRFLRSVNAERARQHGARGPVRRLAAVGLLVLLALPLASAALYARLGEPGSEDLPLAARLEALEEAGDVSLMVAAAETRLQRNPDDARGWEVMAPIYLRLGEHAKAAEAFERTIALLGPEPPRFLGRGEALVNLAGGVVTDEAAEAFEAAAALDADLVAPKFYRALRLSQQGEFMEAAPAWRTVIAESPDNAPWLSTARAALAHTERRLDNKARAALEAARP